MNPNLFISLIVGFSILQTLWVNIAIYDPRYNTVLIALAILTALMLPIFIYFFPQWGAWFVLAFWLIFGNLPWWIKAYARKLIEKNRFDDAIRLQYIARFLHPFNQNRALPRITEAQKLETKGDIEGTIQILQQFENDPSWRIYAMDKIFSLKKAFPERLKWYQENLSDKDYRRDPSILFAYIRALATVGDLNTMLQEFMRLKDAAERIPKRLMENYMIIFAYCGRVEQVEALLASNFQSLPDDSKQVWIGLSNYAAGNQDKAVQILTEILHQGSKMMQERAQSILDVPPVFAHTVLNEESRSILKDLEFELEKTFMVLKMV